MLVFGSSIITAQNENVFFSVNNRLRFGNYLFNDHDYLRAINEYKAVLKSSWNDTLQFKIGLANYKMGKYRLAIGEFGKVKKKSKLKSQAELEKIRSFYKLGNYRLLRNKISEIMDASSQKINLLRLNNISFLLDKSPLSDKKTITENFENNDRSKIETYYNFKINPPYKSETKAGVLSAIIPGLGKVYADETGDGITAFLLTGIFTYLSVNKFQNNHIASGWLYASIAAFFYAGNIYGSVAAVQNYNAGIRFNFENEVKIFINKRNQFLPVPRLEKSY